MGRVHVGTSGWSYDHWRRRLPTAEMLQHWAESTPDGFLVDLLEHPRRPPRQRRAPSSFRPRTPA